MEWRERVRALANEIRKTWTMKHPTPVVEPADGWPTVSLEDMAFEAAATAVGVVDSEYQQIGWAVVTDAGVQGIRYRVTGDLLPNDRPVFVRVESSHQ